MIDCAELCARRGRPAAAVRLYAAAFALKPQIAANHNRYPAACAAVRAGLGQGEDAPRDARQRAKLREQGLAWLLAERDARARRYTQGTAAIQRSELQTIRFRLVDQTLAGVRDPAVLERLGNDERRRWQAFWSSMAVLAVGEPLVNLESAQAYAAGKRWQLAAACYAQVIHLNGENIGQAWFEYAAVQLLGGDRQGYLRTCVLLVNRSAAATGVRPYHTARAWTLSPAAVEDVEKVKRLSAAELTQYGKSFWSLTEQGALLHRLGQSAEAVPLLEQSLAANTQPGARVVNHLWLALACQRLGRMEEARKWRDSAAAWLDALGGEMPSEARAPGLHLHNWLEAHVLRKEADALLR
jgi:tetratricopeptide (TPR) repeat protein